MTKRTFGAVSLAQGLRNLNPENKQNKRVNTRYFNEHQASKYTTIGAVYPYINSEAFKETMKRYKLYVSTYNELIKSMNKDILAYNDVINQYYKQDDIEPAYKSIAGNFKTRYRKLYAHKYNEKVEQTNHELRLKYELDNNLIPKRKIQKVTVQAEKVFVACLYQYNKTFRRINKASRETGVKAFRGLPKIDFNSGQIKALKENDHHLVGMCTKTIRSHRKRLEEAQILRDYAFHGQDRGIKLHVNNQILVVYDQFEKKITNLENQIVSSKERKLFPDNNIITIIKIKENNKKESSHTLTENENDFLQEPTLASCVKNQIPTKKDLHQPKNSSDFRKWLINEETLAKKLANGDYYFSPEIQTGYLQDEALTGSLTQLEFQQVLINYFMMKISCIYNKEHVNASYGSWKVAIRGFKDKFLVNNNGTLKTKTEMASLFIKIHLFGIDEVVKYSKEKPDFNFQYPNLYLRVSNGKVKNAGYFYFARQKYEQKLAELTQDEIQAEKQRQEEIEARNKTEFKSSAYTRLLKQVRLHLNGHRTLEQLVSYAYTNHSKDFYDRLSDIINEEKARRKNNEKAVA